jgi:hypothetical protein
MANLPVLYNANILVPHTKIINKYLFNQFKFSMISQFGQITINIKHLKNI